MNTLGEIVASLPLVKQHHDHENSLYKILEKFARQESEKMFEKKDFQKRSLGPLGDFYFPYFKMGAIDSIDLFSLDELIIFSFYWANRNRYKKVLDIGANIGLHTTMMAKCGYSVTLFEPDPTHFEKLTEILSKNEISNVTAHQAAVSNHKGTVQFIRVLGNTTSSHIEGCKEPYGELEKFEVPVFDVRELIKSADFFKMDVEGHEATIIKATKEEDWNKTDAMIEVGAPEQAEKIFSHLQKIGVRSFSQKIGWAEVKTLQDIPTSYKEGSLFISKKDTMPW